MFYRPSRTEAPMAMAIELVQKLRFGLVISTLKGELQMSHIPLLIDVEDEKIVRIRGHVARANPHWQALEQEPETVIVFNGPNAYISAQWYTKDFPAAPSWTYAVVHVHGTARITGREELERIVDDLVAVNEAELPQQWSVADYSPTRRATLMPHIVGFVLDVTAVEPKFNIKRHFADADKRGIVAGLRARGTDNGRQIAEYMQATISESGDKPRTDIASILTGAVKQP